MKAVLVIDVPEDYMGSDIDVKLYGKTQTIHERYVNKLRPLPQKKNTSKLQGFGNSQIMWTDRTIYQNEGWNDCLKEITGEKDESTIGY